MVHILVKIRPTEYCGRITHSFQLTLSYQILQAYFFSPKLAWSWKREPDITPQNTILESPPPPFTGIVAFHSTNTGWTYSGPGSVLGNGDKVGEKIDTCLCSPRTCILVGKHVRKMQVISSAMEKNRNGRRYRVWRAGLQCLIMSFLTRPDWEGDDWVKILRISSCDSCGFLGIEEQVQRPWDGK